MEAFKAEIAMTEAIEARRKIRELKETFQEMLADDGMICEREAPRLYALLMEMHDEIEDVVGATRDTYVAKRIVQVVERGRGFDFSEYHAGILATGNLAPIRAGLNVVPLHDDDRPRAA